VGWAGVSVVGPDRQGDWALPIKYPAPFLGGLWRSRPMGEGLARVSAEIGLGAAGLWLGLPLPWSVGAAVGWERRLP
jgi:hypothetical protein